MRELLFFILNKEEYLDEILELFIELGVSGATIFESVGMGRVVTHEIPIFAGFRNLMTGSKPYNKTIIAVVEADVVEDIVKGVEEICGNLDEPGTGLIFTIPLSRVWGLARRF